jgi:hypothetical protein
MQDQSGAEKHDASSQSLLELLNALSKTTTTDDAAGLTVRQNFVVRPLGGGILEHVFTALDGCDLSPGSYSFLYELVESQDGEVKSENSPSGEAVRAHK